VYIKTIIKKNFLLKKEKFFNFKEKFFVKQLLLTKRQKVS